MGEGSPLLYSQQASSPTQAGRLVETWRNPSNGGSGIVRYAHNETWKLATVGSEAEAEAEAEADRHLCVFIRDEVDAWDVNKNA